MLLSYPCLCMRISNQDRVHPLIYIFSHSHCLPCGNINDTPVYSRVKCYSGIPCACGFIRGSWNTATQTWRLRASSPGDVGMRQQAFLAPLPGKAQSGIYRQSCEQNRDWYSHAKQAILALFSCLCWYENRVVYDRFRLAAKLLLRSRVTFEEDASSSRITSKITLGSRTNHRIVVTS